MLGPVQNDSITNVCKPQHFNKAFPVTVTFAEAGNIALTIQLLRELRSLSILEMSIINFVFSGRSQVMLM